MAPDNINKNIQWHVLFPLCTILVVGSAALKLPYEVQQSILTESELDDLKDLKRMGVVPLARSTDWISILTMLLTTKSIPDVAMSSCLPVLELEILEW